MCTLHPFHGIAVCYCEYYHERRERAQLRARDIGFRVLVTIRGLLSSNISVNRVQLGIFDGIDSAAAGSSEDSGTIYETLPSSLGKFVPHWVIDTRVVPRLRNILAGLSIRWNNCTLTFRAIVFQFTRDKD